MQNTALEPKRRKPNIIMYIRCLSGLKILPASDTALSATHARQNLRRQPCKSFIEVCRNSAAAAGSGVRLVVNLGKVLKIEVGVDLRGRDISMT